MSFPIASIRDDFENNTIDPLWATTVSGLATVAETTGQARFTLPSSTAGTHHVEYASTATYDLTGDGFTLTVGTMVATGVNAFAFLDLRLDTNNFFRIIQQSNTIFFQKAIAGSTTTLFSTTWSSTTYKYWRIRESGGTIFYDSSSNGTSWTNRASIVGLPFAVTLLSIVFGAECGNVASPGSFRVDDVNLILPAPSSTWRYTTADWSITNRLRPVTLASDGGKQGVLVTADTMDSAGVLGGTVRYFAGPLGSSSGGYLQATEYASLALAQASAFPVPVNGRVDLPAMVDARYMRLYHRSTDASAHTIYEYVPRRIVQADDIEAESIRAINIAADAVTADKIFVISLAAITASMGALHMDGIIDITTTGGIYQGSGTFASPTTGLKIYNSGGVGRLATYSSGVEQVTLDTDGKLKAGAGAIRFSAAGAAMTAETADIYNPTSAYTWYQSNGTTTVGQLWGSTTSTRNTLWLVANETVASNQGGLITLAAEGVNGTNDALITLSGQRTGFVETIGLSATGGSISLNTPSTTINGGLNVGSATGASTGQVATSGNVGIGTSVNAAIRTLIQATGTTSSTYALTVKNSSAADLFYVRDDGYVFINKSGGSLAFFGAAGGTKPTVTGSRGSNAALASLLTALSGLGLLTDSST